MPEKTLLAWIKSLNKPVFTAAGLAAVSGKSASTISQGLSFLRGQGLVSKIYHGVWSEGGYPSEPLFRVALCSSKTKGLCFFYQRSSSAGNNRADSADDYSRFGGAHQGNQDKRRVFSDSSHRPFVFLGIWLEQGGRGFFNRGAGKGFGGLSLYFGI